MPDESCSDDDRKVAETNEDSKEIVEEEEPKTCTSAPTNKYVVRLVDDVISSITDKNNP